MAIDALCVLATAAILARSHARDKAKRHDLVFRRLITVLMCAAPFVRALVSKKMDVAHLHLLDAVDFSFVIVLARRINALAGTVAGNDFFAIGGLVSGRC